MRVQRELIHAVSVYLSYYCSALAAILKHYY
jgi:hypothetical protein